MVTSIIGGDLSDRIGRKKMIIAGWTIYALVYAGFAFVTTSWQAWALFIIYGAYFGLSEGTEKALVADMVGDEKRGTAYGFYNLAFGITVFPACCILDWSGRNSAHLPPFSQAPAVSIIAALALLTVRANPDAA